MIIMFRYFTFRRIRNPRVHWLCSHCYYFNGIRSNSLNIFVTWENCQYFARRNQNIRTIKRNVQTLHSTFLLTFLALKLSSLDCYLSRQYISNNQFSWWPAIPELLTSNYADCVSLLCIFEMPIDIPPKAARSYFQIHLNDTYYSVFLWQPFSRAQSFMGRCL